MAIPQSAVPPLPPSGAALAAGPGSPTRGAAIATLLEEVTRAWPAGASMDAALRSSLLAEFSREPLGDIDATLDGGALRSLAAHYFNAVLDGSPAELLKVHETLVAAEQGQHAPEVVGDRALEAFEQLRDIADRVLLRQDNAAGAVHAALGRAMARVFADALRSLGPGRPFTIQLDEIVDAMRPDVDPASRMHAGLLLAATDRLALLSSAGVIGPLRFAAQAPADEFDADWIRDTDGSYLAPQDDALLALTELQFDPASGRVRDVLEELRGPWDSLAGSAGAFAPADEAAGSTFNRVEAFADAVLDDIAQCNGRPAAAWERYFGAPSWQNRMQEAQLLIDALNQGPDSGHPIAAALKSLMATFPGRLSENLALLPTVERPPSLTSPMTPEQRATAIAAALQADTAGWPLVTPDADRIRERVLPGLRNAAATELRIVPAAPREAALGHMLDALLNGSLMSNRDAYLTLLDAVDPERLRTPARLTGTALVFRRLRGLVWDGIAAAVPEYPANTAHALAGLFEAAVVAAPGQMLKLDFDGLEFSGQDSHLPSTQASLGVRFELYDTLTSLSRDGVIGPVRWVTRKQRPGTDWIPSGDEFQSASDMRVLRAHWRFEPHAGFLELTSARGFDRAPVAPAAPRRSGASPEHLAQHAGNVDVVCAMLQRVLDGWRDPAATGAAAAGPDPLPPPRSGDSQGTVKDRSRAIGRSVAQAIREASVAALRRTYDMTMDLIRATRDGAMDPAVARAMAAEEFRRIVRRAETLIAARADGDSRHVRGRVLASFFADLLISATHRDTPLTLDVEQMRDAIERHYARSARATAYAGLVVSMRDQLALMTRAGVIGPVAYAARRVPHNDGAHGWTFDAPSSTWRTSRDLLAERWRNVGFDPSSSEILVLRRDDLSGPWRDYIADLDSQAFDGADDEAVQSLEDWATETEEALNALLDKPLAERAAGMSDEAWRGRIDAAEKLRDRIKASGVSEKVADFADALVTMVTAAGRNARTPAFQSVFGRGTVPEGMPPVDAGTVLDPSPAAVQPPAPEERARPRPALAPRDSDALVARALVAGRLELNARGFQQHARRRLSPDYADQLLKRMQPQLDETGRRAALEYLKENRESLIALRHVRTQFIRPFDLLTLHETLLGLRRLLDRQPGAAASPGTWTPGDTLRFMQDEDPTSWSGLRDSPGSPKRESAELLLLALDSADRKTPITFDVERIRGWFKGTSPEAQALTAHFLQLFPVLESLSGEGLIGPLRSHAPDPQSVREQLDPDRPPNLAWATPLRATPDMPLPGWEARQLMLDPPGGRTSFNPSNGEILLKRTIRQNIRNPRYLAAQVSDALGQFSQDYAVEVDEWLLRWSEKPDGTQVPVTGFPRRLRVDATGIHVRDSDEPTQEIQVAERQADGRLRDIPAARRLVRTFLDRVVVDKPAERPVHEWRNALTPAHEHHEAWLKARQAILTPGEPPAKRPRMEAQYWENKLLRIVLQLDDSPAAFEASLRFATKYQGRVAWIQHDADGGRRVLAGADLLEKEPAAPLKLVIIGKSSLDAMHRPLLSGRTSTELGRLAGAEPSLAGHFRRLRFVTLLSCALESPFAAGHYGDSFIRSLYLNRSTGSTGSNERPARLPSIRVTSYARPVLFPDDEPASTKRFTREWPGGPRLHRASETTFITKGSHQTENRIKDKYPAGPRHVLDGTTDPDTQYDASALDVREDDTADHVDTVLEDLFDAYEPALDGEPSEALKELFTDAAGRIDDARLQRVAGDLTEELQLRSDIGQALRDQAQQPASTAIAAHELIDDSLAGLALTLDGVALPAEFLASLGARLDGQPLTADSLRLATANGHTDLSGRVQLDPARFEQLLPLLPEGEDSAARLVALQAWLRARQAKTGEHKPLFHGTASSRAGDLVAWLTAVADGGPDAAPGDTTPLAAVSEPGAVEPQAPEAGGTDTGETGETGDTGDTGDTPQERELKDIVRDAKDPLELGRLSRMTSAQALSELHASGALEINANGTIRLDESHLATLIAGADDAALMRVSTALLQLPEPLLDDLHADSSARGRSLLDKVRQVRAEGVSRSSGTAWQAVGGHAFGWANTVVGAFQIAQGWRHMDAAQKWLSVAQISGIVTTPLTVKVGEWLQSWADDLKAVAAESRPSALAGAAFSRLGTVLMAGSLDVGLASLGVLMCGLQWRDFWKSGQPVGGYAYKSLVANTTVAAVFLLHSLVSTGINLAVLAAGGAEAVAGTLLGAAAGVMSAAAIPFAVAAIAVAGAVNCFLWAEEYAGYIDPSTPWGEVVKGTLAKMFGFETDTFRHAEVAKTAHDAAKARADFLVRQRQEYLAFRGKQLAKTGRYGTILYPKVDQKVWPATFRVPDGDPPFAFVLQDDPARVLQDWERRRVPSSPAAASGTAWLALRGLSWPTLPAATGAQLFELQGVEGDFAGGEEADVFLLDGQSFVHVDGRRGTDELVLDASSRHLKMIPAKEQAGLLYTMSRTGAGFTGAHYAALTDVESITVRDAESAHVTGGAGDERFDVSGLQTDIAGGGGRNTYVLRPGNRIVSSSSDAAIWSRGVSATIDFDGKPADTPLMLRTDVLHESLSFRREGTTLFIGNGADTLTLLDFFVSSNATSKGPRRLFIVDAVGTHLTLADPRRLEGAMRGSDSVDKHLSFDASTPEPRRALTGDHAFTRHHLLSGSGDFRLAPRTLMPMDVTLDIEIARLRYERKGDDLILIESPPADAPADFKPLRLTLPGYAKRDWTASHGQLSLWARGATNETAAVKLAHPAPADPDEGAMRRAAPAAGAPVQAPAQAPARASVHAPAQVPVHDAGDAGDVLEASTATPVLSRKSAAKVYTADDDRPVQATAPGVHIVESGPGAPWSPATPRVIHVRPGATAHMRGRSLEVTAGEGADRTTVHVLDYFRAPGHFRFEPLSDETAWTMKQLTHEHSPPLLPENFRDFWLHIYRDLDADPWIAPLLHGAGIKDPAMVKAVSGISTDLRRDTTLRFEPSKGTAAEHAAKGSPLRWTRPVSTAVTRMSIDPQEASPGAGSPSEDIAHDLAAVRTYLRLKGLSPEVANAVQSTTTHQLRRVHRLLAAASDGRTALPAAFIDAYAASSVDTPLNASHHGALIRSLAARALPWDYVEAVLKHGLSSQALLAFEAWASQHAQGGLAGAHAIRAMEEFDRLLDGRHGADAAITPDTRALLTIALRLDGRPDDVIEALAEAMVAVTLDRDWVDGMLRAGVNDLDQLKRLHAAKVSVQDLVIGNANRHLYEGDGDRSAVIEVSTCDLFRQPPKSLARYLVKNYLKFDYDGKIELNDPTPRPDVTYHLLPGQVVDANGLSPDPAAANNDRYETIQRLTDAFNRKEGLDDPYKHWTKEAREYVKRHRDSYVKKHTPPLSSVVQMFNQGLAGIERLGAGGAWFGRSTPGNLVDGSTLPDEVTAWRPFFTLSKDDGTGVRRAPPLFNDDDPASPVFIRFDFQHAIALTEIRLQLKLRPDPSETKADPHSMNQGRLKVQALTADDQWIDVSPDLFFENVDATLIWKVNTQGAPHRAYRLMGAGGGMPTEAWFTEVTFETAEVGIEGPIAPPEGNSTASQRMRAIASRLPVLESALIRPETLEPLRSHVAALVLDTFGLAGGQPLPDYVPQHFLDAAQGRTESLMLAFNCLTSEGFKREGPTAGRLAQFAVLGPPTRPAALAYGDQTVVGVLSVYERLIDALFDRFAKGQDPIQALKATVPLYLNLLALKAAANWQPLQLRMPAGDTSEGKVVLDLMNRALGALQPLENAKLLDVRTVVAPAPLVSGTVSGQAANRWTALLTQAMASVDDAGAPASSRGMALVDGWTGPRQAPFVPNDD